MTGRIRFARALSDRSCPMETKPPSEGDSDDRRILPEKRLHDPYLLWASGIWATSPDAYPIETWLRRDETFRRVLCGRLCLQTDTSKWYSSLVPVVQPGIRKDVRRHRELGEWEGVARPACQDWLAQSAYDTLAMFDIRAD